MEGRAIKILVKEYPSTWDYLNLYPISDLHLGAAECMEDAFTDYVRKIAKDNRAAVILAGDMINNGLKNSRTNIYDELYSPSEQKRRLIKMLEPIADKILCYVEGNHERRTRKEVDISVTEEICFRLGIPCGDNMTFIKLSLGKKTCNQKPATYMICVTHGNGGGNTLAGNLNALDNLQLSVEGVDIMITGHTHKPSKLPSPRLVFDPYNNVVSQRNTCVFVCTGWLKYDGYPAEKMLKPVAFYPDIIRLDGKAKVWK